MVASTLGMLFTRRGLSQGVRRRLIYQTGSHRGQPLAKPCGVSVAGPGSVPGHGTPLGFRHRGQPFSKAMECPWQGRFRPRPRDPTGPGVSPHNQDRVCSVLPWE